MTKSCGIAAVLVLILVAVPASAQTHRLAGVKFAPAEGTSTAAKSTAATSPNQPAAMPAVKQDDPDDEGPLEITGYVGLALDTFAANDLRKYLNPDDVGGVSERHIVGIDFSYRLWKSAAGGQAFWLYGETVNGVRSSDVDCKEDATIPVCKPFTDVANAPDATLFALRNATSLEAFVGARFHLFSVNKKQPGPSNQGKTNEGPSASVYLKAQAGFLTVADNGSDVVDMHHVGVGLMLHGKSVGGTYLEAGWGRNDLFKEKPHGRLKIDGFLTMAVSEEDKVRPFIQMTVDADLGNGADSIQIYLGIDLSLEKIFKKQ